MSINHNVPVHQRIHELTTKLQRVSRKSAARKRNLVGLQRAHEALWHKYDVALREIEELKRKG